jgi:hypothetical protein
MIKPKIQKRKQLNKMNNNLSGLTLNLDNFYSMGVINV